MRSRSNSRIPSATPRARRVIARRPHPLDPVPAAAWPRDTSGEARLSDSFITMKPIEKFISESGKIGYALLWLIGIPLPVLLIIYLIRGH